MNPEIKSIGFGKMLFRFILILVFVAGLYFLGNKILVEKNSTLFNSDNTSSENYKRIQLQTVNNVGYTFYLGRIDYLDALEVSDDLKNQVTQIIANAHFPKSLLKSVAIIFVNTLAVESRQVIIKPDGGLLAVNADSFGTEFLNNGGFYVQSAQNFSVIFINKNKIGNNLPDLLTHELGHHLATTLSDTDWKTFYELRDIPANTPRITSYWSSSPSEDFAEVYKNIYTGYSIDTNYGYLEPVIEIFEITCRKNPTQRCRREVLDNPLKYPDDHKWGRPYKSIVGPQTKKFVESIMQIK